ncbi:MAG: VCBS repeat-containing protein [Planctomycetota bacterium]
MLALDPRRLVAVFCFGLLVGTTGAQSYAPVVRTDFGGGLLAAAAADFDGDGFDDIVSGDALGASLTVMMNDGAGNFSAGPVLSTSSGPIDLYARDVDGDGDADIATITNVGNQFIVFLNDGAGNFSAGIAIPAGAGPFRMLPFDVDSDGDEDVLVANVDVNQVSLILNNGGGSFTYVGAATGVFGPAAFASGDLDADGDLDLVVTSAQSNAILIVRNDGTAFTPLNFLAVGGVPLDVLIVDTNHDLRPDIVTANTASGTISVLRNQGGFNFNRVDFPTLLTPARLALTNADNALGVDIAVTCFIASKTAVMTNDGSGNFSIAFSTLTGANPLGLVSLTGDADLDDDLGVIDFATGSLRYLENLRPTTLYPGTGEDLETGIGVDGPAVYSPAVQRLPIAAGQTIEFGMHSPLGTYVGANAFLIAQLMYPGFPPISPAPGLHVNFFGFGLIVVLDSPALAPAGEVFSTVVPGGLASLCMIVQSVVSDPAAANGIYAASDAREFEFLP